MGPAREKGWLVGPSLLSNRQGHAQTGVREVSCSKWRRGFHWQGHTLKDVDRPWPGGPHRRYVALLAFLVGIEWSKIEKRFPADRKKGNRNDLADIIAVVGAVIPIWQTETDRKSEEIGLRGVKS